MTARLHHWTMVSSYQAQTIQLYAQNMRVLFDSVFLQDGHIALSASSCFRMGSDPASVAGVDSADALGLLEDVSKMKFTGIRCFRLDRV